MAVAAPARRSKSQAAPAPARTAPPDPKKRPRDRPRPGGRGRSATAAAPATAPARKPATPQRKAAPPRRKATSARAAATAPARKAPTRRKAAPRRRAGVIPIAAGHAGRAAVAVTQLPESGLIHRLTRGRAWIGVLGVLLVGIVALNVVTLSFAASAGKVDAKITALSKENSMLQSRVAERYGQARIRRQAAELGLAMPTKAVPQLLTTRRTDATEAAARLAAAAATTAAATSGEEGATEEGATEEGGATEGAVGGEAAAGEEVAAGSTSEGEFTPEEEAIYNREYEELLAAEGAAGTAEPAYGEAGTEAPTG